MRRAGYYSRFYIKNAEDFLQYLSRLRVAGQVPLEFLLDIILSGAETAPNSVEVENDSSK